MLLLNYKIKSHPKQILYNQNCVLLRVCPCPAMNKVCVLLRVCPCLAMTKVCVLLRVCPCPAMSIDCFNTSSTTHYPVLCHLLASIKHKLLLLALLYSFCVWGHWFSAHSLNINHVFLYIGVCNAKWHRYIYSSITESLLYQTPYLYSQISKILTDSHYL